MTCGLSAIGLAGCAMADAAQNAIKIPPITYKNRHFMGQLFFSCIGVFAPFPAKRLSSRRGRTPNLYQLHPLSSDGLRHFRLTLPPCTANLPARFYWSLCSEQFAAIKTGFGS